MEEILEALVAGGLSESAAKLYVSLLKSGSTSPASILKKSKSVKGKRALDELIEKGFATRTTGKKLVVTAADPKIVLQSVEDESARIAAVREKTLKLLEPLRLLGVKASVKPQIQFFVGQEGARAALEDSLGSREKTLRAFFAMADVSDFLGQEFLEQYHRRRVGAGLNLQVVRTFERDKRKTARPKSAKKYLSSKEERFDVRFVSEDLAFPMTVFLYDQKVLAISSREENFAFILESKEFCLMQKKLFELAWKSIAIRSIALS